LIWILWKLRNDLTCVVGKLLRSFASSLNPGIPFHHGEDIAERNRIVTAVREDLLHHGALSLTRGFECIDKRQRNLALAQVAANRLAQGLLERRKVQHVVDELESHAEIPGEIPEAFFELRLRAARHRAEFGAGGKQAGRL